MVPPVLADKSWLRKMCSESRNQHRSLEPNSVTLKEKENTRRAGSGRNADRNPFCIHPSGSWDIFTL